MTSSSTETATSTQPPQTPAPSTPNTVQEPSAATAEAPSTDAPVPGEENLGDAGKKALDAMKAKWKDADALAKARETELAALKAKVEGKEAEHQASLAAQQVKDDALAAANQRILSAEIRASAAGKLNDPSDALAYLDLSSFEVSDDGAVDATAIQGAITDLITRKPYLAAQGGTGFQGSADQGTRTVSQKTVDEQIRDFEAAGNHTAAAALKSQQLLELRNQNPTT